MTKHDLSHLTVLADASLPGLEQAFPPPFILTKYHSEQEIPSLLPQQKILLCRSTLKVTPALLSDHHLHYVATASSGTDHLNHKFLNSQGIQIIDAKGSNAPAVADYVMSCIAYLNTSKRYMGKKAGIIGLGKVGEQVKEKLQIAGFEIIEYDPLKELNELDFKSASLDKIYQCDLICIHAELHEDAPHRSYNLVNHSFLSELRPGTVIINAARGGIVNEQDLLENKRPIIYCSDVYINEPDINPKIIDLATLCTPHIAGHSIEAKFAAIAYVSSKLHHIMGLSLPNFAEPLAPTKVRFAAEKPWQEQLLAVYNPLRETQLLKEARNKREAFLTLRQAHHFRHDFSVCFDL